MNNNAQRLVKALRSGEYEQTKTRLRVGNKFCCLGVACDLYRVEHPDEAEWTEAPQDNGVNVFQVKNALPKVGEMPSEVMNWLGFSDPLGRFMCSSLTEVNDRGVSFEAIADIIEDAPAGLFTEDPTYHHP